MLKKANLYIVVNGCVLFEVVVCMKVIRFGYRLLYVMCLPVCCSSITKLCKKICSCVPFQLCLPLQDVHNDQVQCTKINSKQKLKPCVALINFDVFLFISLTVCFFFAIAKTQKLVLVAQLLKMNLQKHYINKCTWIQIVSQKVKLPQLWFPLLTENNLQQKKIHRRSQGWSDGITGSMVSHQLQPTKRYWSWFVRLGSIRWWAGWSESFNMLDVFCTRSATWVTGLCGFSFWPPGASSTAHKSYSPALFNVIKCDDHTSVEQVLRLS